jgi:drug/metabolite transporter (DMT)-like permease
VTRNAVRLGLLASVGDLTGTVAYLAATVVGTLSVTVVLVSLFPVSTALLARVVLHERLSRVRVAGVALAVAGAALIGVGEVAGG